MKLGNQTISNQECPTLKAVGVKMYAELKRTCKRCGIEKMNTEFYSERTKWRPLDQCKPCVLGRAKNYAAQYRAKHPEKVTGAKLKCTYGITLEEYKAKLATQNNVCGICHKPNVPYERLSVDHDHKTKMVRDLLCRKCNMEVGIFEKNYSRLSAYINKFKN